MTDRRNRSAFAGVVRLAAGALVALLLGQSATALLAHAHVSLPAGAGCSVEAAAPGSSSPSPAGHDLLDCRVCRLRAELDRPAPLAWTHRAERSRSASCLALLPASDALRELRQAGSRPARAPPVLS
jgi:hypothetical protein